MPKPILVVYGGVSAERSISIKSGEAIIAALTRLGYDVISLDVQGNWAEQILEVKDNISLVFNGLHGGYGEDGTLSAFCESLNLPYTGSPMLAAAIALDKVKAKAIFKEAGLDVPKGLHFNGSDLPNVAPFMPCVVKPSTEGSSVGVYLVKSDEDWQAAKKGSVNQGEMLVEEYIQGREFAVPVMKSEALGVIEMIPETDAFYTYEAKYAQGGSRHVVSPDIPAEITEKLEKASLTAHQVLGCGGVSRADMIWQESTGRVVILETNTLPGMTETSLVPEVAEVNLGWSFDQLVQKMIEDVACIKKVA